MQNVHAGGARGFVVLVCVSILSVLLVFDVAANIFECVRYKCVMRYSALRDLAASEALRMPHSSTQAWADVVIGGRGRVSQCAEHIVYVFTRILYASRIYANLVRCDDVYDIM